MKTRRPSVASLERDGQMWLMNGDWVQGAACLYQASTRGSADAAFALGLLYEMDPPAPDFIHDDVQAAKFFHLAAERGHVEANMHLAQMYESGTGVEKNREKAGQYWETAARAGHVEAMDFYASFLFFDVDEPERRLNARKAKRWLKAALRKGSSAASIGLRYMAQWERDGYLDMPEVNMEDEVFDFPDEGDAETDEP